MLNSTYPVINYVFFMFFFCYIFKMAKYFPLEKNHFNFFNSLFFLLVIKVLIFISHKILLHPKTCKNLIFYLFSYLLCFLYVFVCFFYFNVEKEFLFVVFFFEKLKVENRFVCVFVLKYFKCIKFAYVLIWIHLFKSFNVTYKNLCFLSQNEIIALSIFLNANVLSFNRNLN